MGLAKEKGQQVKGLKCQKRPNPGWGEKKKLEKKEKITKIERITPGEKKTFIQWSLTTIEHAKKKVSV